MHHDWTDVIAFFVPILAVRLLGWEQNRRRRNRGCKRIFDMTEEVSLRDASRMSEVKGATTV
jgi:hypothetical protein